MSCTLTLPNSKLDQALRESIGTRDTLITNYISTIMKDDKYEQSFVDELDAMGIDVYNIPDSDLKVVVNFIKEYTNRLSPSVKYSAQNTNSNAGISKYDYTSIDAREEAKRHGASFALNTYNLVTKQMNTSLEKLIQEESKRKGRPVTKREFLANNITAQFKAEIRNRLVERNLATLEEAKKLLANNNVLEIEKLFGDNKTIQDQNLLATYKEILGNREAFFDEVYRNGDLGELRIEKLNELQEDNTYQTVDEQQDDSEGENGLDDGNNISSDDTDTYIKNLNEKLGDYTTFMSHLDMDVKAYLGSLKKLNSGNKINGKPDYNTDNNLGIPETMSAAQCSAILYSSVDYTNRETMINSIIDVANKTPGFQAFHQLAEDLKSNPDLLNKIYSTYSKFVISKTETVVDGDSAVSRTSNRTANKLDSLKFEYLNGAKATTTLIDADISDNLFKEISDDIKAIKDLQNDINSIIGNSKEDIEDREAFKKDIEDKTNKLTLLLAKQLHRYYPTLEDSAIANYIKSARDGNVSENIQVLANILKKTINNGKVTYDNYSNRQTQIGRNYYRLQELEALLNDNIDFLMDRKLMKENEGLKTKKEIREAIKEVNNTLEELFATDYVDKGTQGAAFDLAKELVNYATVKTELNSRNVHGNQSSDVINNSMITNLMNTLKSQIALENYGKYKSQTRQYDFSNIMVEHRDENGKVINFGLFRHNEQSNDFEPTEYAERLLRARLFSGATDVINSSNVLYSEMSKGDYVATSFVNFFNVEDVVATNDNGIQFANYFMRIPSDAPKNFIMIAPKYSVRETKQGANDGLFQITDVAKLNTEINKRINNLPVIDKEEFDTKYLTGNPVERSLGQLISNVTAEKIGDIRIPGKSFVNENKAKEGDEVTVTFNYQQKDKGEKYGVNNTYVLKGKLAQRDGNYYLESPEFVGFSEIGHSQDVNNSLKKHFRKEVIDEGLVETSINTNHPIFKQFRNIFVQELTDAANTLNKFFINDKGLIATDKNGFPLFNEGFDNSRETAKTLYSIYHVSKDEKGNKPIYEVKDGRAVLTGRVFTSDRFVITKTDENGKVVPKNYGEELINEAFDFLYGRANDKYLHTTSTEKGVKLELTDEQNAAIDRKLSEFIKDYIADTNERMEEYKEFLPEHLITDDNIAEFALNHHIMFANFNDLFEGDTKFYKDVQTFLKRSKESQGSGVPYGIVDYNVDLSAAPQKIDSSLDDANFNHIDKNGVSTPFKVELRDKFKGVTVKNTIKTGETIGVFERNAKGEIVEDKRGIPKMVKVGSLTAKLIKTLRDSGYTAQAASDKAKKMMAGYADTTVNDAQSYITFEEWIRRITARGQFPRYKTLIEAILDETKPLDASVIGEFVQVQKNFYYDQYYNARLGTMVPRQIKNAEFVLIPRLIEGTQLEEVYKLMKEKGIDQLNTEETSKAGKANVLTLWDNEGNLTQENKDKFRLEANESSIETFNYNYLYTQQETPQHINAENKAGIQIMKKIVDNIAPNSPLYPIKQKFFKLYSANIKASHNELLKELGLKTDKNGNLQINEDGSISGFNAQIFLNMLQDEVMRLGLDSNAIDYVTPIDGNLVDLDNAGVYAVTKMPTYFGNYGTKLENIAQSLFNNRITRQKLPGFHAAQITNVGFSPLGNKKDNTISYSKDLKYHPNGEPYVEIMLPASNFGLQRTKKDDTLKTDAELLEELQKAGLDEVIGYRIPTEGKQSVCVMKIAGFIDDALGSTIVVPDDWVSQTGSDFDIDSVYGIQFKGKLNKDGVLEKIAYDDNKSELENSRDARNNEILKCMIDILKADSSLEENLSRSQFKPLTDARDKAIDDNVKARRKARSPYNFLDQAEYQDDVMSGAKLKAFSVTRDTFCSICNTVRPVISPTHSIKVVYRKQDGYDYNTLSKSFTNIEKLDDNTFVVTHNTIGWTNNNLNTVGSILTAYSSQTTAHILDAVKEGAIPNENDFTFQVFKTFPDIGSDYETGVSFIMQPGISRIVNAYNKNKSIYSRDNSKPINIAIKELVRDILALDGVTFDTRKSVNEALEAVQKYNRELGRMFGTKGTGFKISTEDEEVGKLLISASRLRDRLKEEGEFKGSSPVKERMRLLFDLGTVLQYNKLNKLGNAISSYARVCNPDKFGAKQSIFATEDVFRSIDSILDREGDNPILTVGSARTPFLEAIYPGIGSYTIDEFIKSNNDKESKYPPLNAFLKYATATSIKINRLLFETQDPDFVNNIIDLQDAFSGNNKRITEKQYKEYQSYILNYLYGKTQVVANPVVYKIGEGFTYPGTGNLEEERRRIFGYGRQPDLMVPVLTEEIQDNNSKVNYVETGDLVEFDVKDINHPTQIEINQFATFTPAQKVFWIQRKFTDKGVFNYLRTSLFNDKKYRRSQTGAQVIEYVENTDSIETVYSQFEDAFYNDNPLIKMAALDIIKYAFAVEGFRMKRNAVNKIIKNNALLDSVNIGGTGIVNELRGQIRSIEKETMQDIRNKFVRSHSSMNQIETHRVDKTDKTTYELQQMSDGFIKLDLTNDAQKALAIKYGLAFETGNSTVGNKYVKLRYGKDTTLFAIRENPNNPNEIVAYPLNLLENNEHSTWSVNIKNNTHLSEEYYEKVLTDYFNRPSIDTTLKQVIDDNVELRKQSRFVNTNKLNRSTYATTFDINDKNTPYSGGFQDVIEQVENHFDELTKEPLYVRSIALGEFIKHTGSENGSVQEINGQLYKIEKVNFDKLNNLYIGKYNIDREIKEDNPSIVKIIENARTHGDYGSYVKNAFKITPYSAVAIEERYSTVDEEYPNVETHSSITQANVKGIQDMSRRAISEKDEKAAAGIKYLNEKNITASSPSVQQNQAIVTSVLAEYVQNSTKELLDNVKYFFRDDNMEYHSIIDPKSIDRIRHDINERDRFLKTLLDARAFVKQYQAYTKLDISSADPELRSNLEKIKKAINDLENNIIIEQAEKQFALDYLAKLSDNPNIQSEIITLLDGFHSASTFDAWINDLQETSSPLLQLITKEVMGDIRAEEMKAKKIVAVFRKEVKSIIDKANAAGKPINWKHIIDEYGRFVQNYKPEFVEQIEAHRDAINKARLEYGEWSPQYIRAKLDYDRFKLNHTNQRLVDSYYQRKLELEEEIYNKAPLAYSIYKKLEEKRRQLLSFSRNGVFEESKQQEYNNLKRQIDSLTRDYYWDEATSQFESKQSNSDPSNPLTGEARSIYSLEAAGYLNDFLDNMKELHGEYFHQDAKFGFDEELRKNLNIIIDYERPFDGRPTTPMSQLMEHEDYVEAKTWLEQNARFVVDESLRKIVNDAYKALKEPKKGQSILSKIAKDKKLYDSHGVIDATKLTDDEINQIREQQLRNYNMREEQPVSDKILISNAPKSNTVFNASFYNGMRSDGVTSQEWIDTINEINQILRPYYDAGTGVLFTHKISKEDLKILVKLYDKLENTEKTQNSTNGKKVRKYINKNVEFVTNDELYDEQRILANQNEDGEWVELWKQLNERIKIDENGNEVVVPNRLIYGYAIPKGYKADGTGDNSQIDTDRTKAIRILQEYTSRTNTEYYYQKFREMHSKSKAEFDAWYKANHIYNPFTHTMEPIQCWTRLEIKPVSDDGEYREAGLYVPAFNQLDTKPNEDKLNTNYKEDASTAANYKQDNSHIASRFRDNTDYSNNAPMTDEEREMKNLFEDILRKNATTAKSKKFIDKGFMAIRAKKPEVDAKFIMKEAAKLVGWIEGNSGREAWYSDVDYANDITPTMPMMAMLKSKDSIKIDYNIPQKKDYATEEEYDKAYVKYLEDKKAAEKQNLKIQKDMLDDNWEDVMADFIMKAAHFNAVQNNKYMLFYAKNMIDKIDTYVKNLGFNDLEKDEINSTEDETKYVTKKDTNLRDQYANWIRRLVYDQWKKRNNAFTKGANILQSLASAKFMMLNITGGIANVTVGETNILAEVLAKDFFGKKHYLQGKALWSSGIPSYFADMYKEKASSLPSAIIKFFNVVDFDELNGVVSVADMQEYLERARDAAFSPQSTGEHFMQNGAMFSLLYSHRLVEDDDAPNTGRLSYKYVNEAEFIRDAEIKALDKILESRPEAKEAFKKFKERELKDANNKKEYAWFRKDLCTQFLQTYFNKDYQVQKEFIEARRDIQAKKREEFNQLPTLMDQLKLDDDGLLGFKEDSILATKMTEDEAYKLLGRFKGRVISVNKKIHGVYDKLGAAQLESHWAGSLIMQYHKHLPMGILKRYRRQGYFNEERGSIEKGIFASLKDFLAIPFQKKAYAEKLKEETGITDAELQAAEGMQNLFKNIIEFTTHLRTNWNMIPESERGNIKRALADLAGVMAAVCFAIALRCMYDDDDESIVYNLFMYEADRLASESFMYNPWGLYSEGKKLWSSPVAVQGGISDILNSAGLVSQWIIQGEDFDPYYQSGLYAGENKFEVMIKRNIPIWHSTNMLTRLNRSNKYYKLTDNMLSVIPIKDIADFITE